MLDLVRGNLKQLRNEAQLLLMGAPAAGVVREAAARRVLLLPAADPGGIGDDAMVSGTQAGIEAVMGAIPLALGAYRTAGWTGAFEKSLPREYFWGPWRSINSASEIFKRYSDLMILGADVMDGLYSPPDAVRRLRYACLAANLGLQSRLLGFSFNAAPHPVISRELANIEQGVTFCLRDPISLARFESRCGAQTRLVADVAFLVDASGPTEHTAGVWEFVSAQRKIGRRVIGLNAHLLFDKTHGSGLVDALALSLGELIRRNTDCAFVLIPHDYRPHFDDRIALKKILQAAPATQDRTLLVTQPLFASEIKEISAYMDGVFTGRMHLSIAALGQGVPIAGIVYQGKFEGLLEHYELGTDLTIDPVAAANVETVCAFFRLWQARLESLSRQIRIKAPLLRELALRNFEA